MRHSILLPPQVTLPLDEAEDLLDVLDDTIATVPTHQVPPLNLCRDQVRSAIRAAKRRQRLTPLQRVVVGIFWGFVYIAIAFVCIAAWYIIVMALVR